MLREDLYTCGKHLEASEIYSPSEFYGIHLTDGSLPDYIFDLNFNIGDLWKTDAHFTEIQSDGGVKADGVTPMIKQK